MLFFLIFVFVSYLCFWQVEMFGKLFAFSSNNILVLFKGLFQFQQLTRAKSCANSLWFAERKQKFGQMRTWKEKYWYIGKSPTDFVLVKLVGLTFLIKYQCFFVRSSIAQIFASFRKPKIIRSAFSPSQLLSIGRSLWKDPICWWSWAHLG